jgi:hypothetical protein
VHTYGREGLINKLQQYSIKIKIMKRILMCWGFVMTGLFSKAQSKQVKMYLNQIAANAVYAQYLKKGINIAQTGLTAITDIRNGEFNLHDLFFKGLSSINPKIKNWTKVADIISYQVNIVKSYKSGYAQIKASGQFSTAEIEYIYSVFSRLLDDCVAIILTLTDVLNVDFYKMSDDERIQRIDVLYANMQNNYKFCQKFSNNNMVMAMQRLKEQNEAAVSRKLFDVH